MAADPVNYIVESVIKEVESNMLWMEQTLDDDDFCTDCLYFRIRPLNPATHIVRAMDFNIGGMESLDIVYPFNIPSDIPQPVVKGWSAETANVYVANHFNELNIEVLGIYDEQPSDFGTGNNAVIVRVKIKDDYQVGAVDTIFYLDLDGDAFPFEPGEDVPDNSLKIRVKVDPSSNIKVFYSINGIVADFGEEMGAYVSDETSSSWIGQARGDQEPWNSTSASLIATPYSVGDPIGIINNLDFHLIPNDGYVLSKHNLTIRTTPENATGYIAPPMSSDNDDENYIEVGLSYQNIYTSSVGELIEPNTFYYGSENISSFMHLGQSIKDLAGLGGMLEWVYATGNPIQIENVLYNGGVSSRVFHQESPPPAGSITSIIKNAEWERTNYWNSYVEFSGPSVSSVSMGVSEFINTCDLNSSQTCEYTTLLDYVESLEPFLPVNFPSSLNPLALNNGIQTGISAQIIISTQPEQMLLGGLPIQTGDVIGVFGESNGIYDCYGFTVWDNSTNPPAVITIWGNGGSGGWGFDEGQEMRIFIKRTSTDVIYEVEATWNTSTVPFVYTNGADGYLSDGFYQILSFNNTVYSGSFETTRYWTGLEMYDAVAKGYLPDIENPEEVYDESPLSWSTLNFPIEGYKNEVILRNVGKVFENFIPEVTLSPHNVVTINILGSAMPLPSESPQLVDMNSELEIT